MKKTVKKGKYENKKFKVKKVKIWAEVKSMRSWRQADRGKRQLILKI